MRHTGESRASRPQVLASSATPANWPAADATQDSMIAELPKGCRGHLAWRSHYRHALGNFSSNRERDHETHRIRCIPRRAYLRLACLQ